MTPQSGKSSKKTRKPKSPPAPRYDLKEALNSARQLYDSAGRSELAKTEVASTLQLSATSSFFHNRLMTLCDYRLVDEVPGKKYAVSEHFLELRDATQGSDRFKYLANQSLRGVDLFRQLISGFSGKMPPVKTVAGQLEREHGFNQKRAKNVAQVLEDSLRFAGLLDTKNNILPAPAELPSRTRGGGQGDRSTGGGERPDDRPEEQDELLKSEVAVEAGKVVIYYPRELSREDAVRVGKMLELLAGGSP